MLTNQQCFSLVKFMLSTIFMLGSSGLSYVWLIIA